MQHLINQLRKNLEVNIKYLKCIDKKPQRKIINAANGRLFKFVQDNFIFFKDGLSKFFNSKIFKQILQMINCLNKKLQESKQQPTDFFKNLAIGLIKNVNNFKAEKLIPIILDVFCQWDKLKQVLLSLEKALKGHKEWSHISNAIIKMLDIFSITK